MWDFCSGYAPAIAMRFGSHPTSTGSKGLPAVGESAHLELLVNSVKARETFILILDSSCLKGVLGSRFLSTSSSCISIH